MRGTPMAEQSRRVDSLILKDPNIAHGRYRPLPRSDGLYIVYCEDLALGKRTVGDRTFETLAKAEAFAKELAAKDAKK